MSPTPAAPTVSRDPLWGRAYKLSVETAQGENIVLSQSGWEPEALRVTFEIQESVLPSPFWFAVITVYNVDDPTYQSLMYNAQRITFDGGYQTGLNKSTRIWHGPVLQVVYDRPHVVDNTITFNCISGRPILNDNFINYAASNNTSSYDAVLNMVSKQGGNANAQTSKYAQSALQAKTYPRGKTFWGTTSKYMQVMADDSFISHYIDFDGNDNMTEIYNPDTKPAIVYGPPYPPGYRTSGSGGPTDTPDITRSIVGTPRQSQWGVTFDVLLDPRLHVSKPPMLIQIEKSALIAQLKTQYGGPINTPLDESGMYIVGQVTHHGDTRGNEWYTTVQAYTQVYAQKMLKGVFAALQRGVTGPIGG
jgi:hypothetical protein